MQSLRHSYHTIPYRAIRYRIVFCNMCQYFSYVHFFLLTVIRSILVIKPSNHVNNICVSQLPEIGNQSPSFFHMTLIHMNKASSGSAWEWSESAFFFHWQQQQRKKVQTNSFNKYFLIKWTAIELFNTPSNMIDILRIFATCNEIKYSNRNPFDIYFIWIFHWPLQMNTKEKSLNELNLIGFQFEYIHFFSPLSA